MYSMGKQGEWEVRDGTGRKRYIHFAPFFFQHLLPTQFGG